MTIALHLLLAAGVFLSTQVGAFPGEGCDETMVPVCPGQGCNPLNDLDPWPCCDTNWDGCCQRMCQGTLCLGPGCQTPPGLYFAMPGGVMDGVCRSVYGTCGPPLGAPPGGQGSG